MPTSIRQLCADVLNAATAAGLPTDMADNLAEGLRRQPDPDRAERMHLHAKARIADFAKLKASCRVLGAPPDAAEGFARAGLGTLDAARETLLKYAGRELLMTPQRGHELRLHLVALAAVARPRGLQGGAAWR